MTGYIPPGSHLPGPDETIIAPPVDAAHEPPAWASARRRSSKRKYHYHCYPNVEVYFDAGRNIYFYPEGGSWLMAPVFPVTYKDINTRVSKALNEDQPIYITTKQFKSIPGILK